MDTIETAKALASLPLTVLLVLVLMGGYLQWWIYGTIHRSQVLELQAQVIAAQARADKWESRFLEVNDKLDGIGHAVNSTATMAEAKLAAVEHRLAAAVSDLQAFRAPPSKGAA